MSHLVSFITILAGMLAGFAATVPLLRRQHRLVGRWQQLATHDDTTGLANRRAITTHLDRAIIHGHRPSVILIDLDQFKKVNDTWGHEAGNDLLRAVADRLLTLSQPVKLVGRLSGDEFVAVVHGDLEQTTAAAHEVWAAISSLPYRIGDDLVEVTASIGYAIARHGISTTELLRQADFAMYVAKHAGRNRIHGHLLANDQAGHSHLWPARYRDHR